MKRGIILLGEEGEVKKKCRKRAEAFLNIRSRAGMKEGKVKKKCRKKQEILEMKFFDAMGVGGNQENAWAGTGGFLDNCRYSK